MVVRTLPFNAPLPFVPPASGSANICSFRRSLEWLFPPSARGGNKQGMHTAPPPPPPPQAHISCSPAVGLETGPGGGGEEEREERGFHSSFAEESKSRRISKGMCLIVTKHIREIFPFPQKSITQKIPVVVHPEPKKLNSFPQAERRRFPEEMAWGRNGPPATTATTTKSGHLPLPHFFSS